MAIQNAYSGTIDQSQIHVLWQQLDMINRWGEQLAQQVYAYLQEAQRIQTDVDLANLST